MAVRFFLSVLAWIIATPASAEDFVREAVVPASGHGIMEENPQATGAIVRGFLEGS